MIESISAKPDNNPVESINDNNEEDSSENKLSNDSQENSESASEVTETTNDEQNQVNGTEESIYNTSPEVSDKISSEAVVEKVVSGKSEAAISESVESEESESVTNAKDITETAEVVENVHDKIETLRAEPQTISETENIQDIVMEKKSEYVSETIETADIKMELNTEVLVAADDSKTIESAPIEELTGTVDTIMTEEISIVPIDNSLDESPTPASSETVKTEEYPATVVGHEMNVETSNVSSKNALTEEITSVSADAVIVENVSVLSDQVSTTADNSELVADVPMTESKSVDTKVIRKGRKPRNTTQETTIKSPAKSPAKATVTKRAYNRRSKPVVPVNVGEEISILSSSESTGSAKESINIMSSSDSNESIPSLPSDKSSLSRTSSIESIKSTRSAKSIEGIESSENAKAQEGIVADKKAHNIEPNGNADIVKSSENEKNNKISNDVKSPVSEKSKASLKSSSSIDSVNSETEIPAWEREACPAIFEKTSLKNPENRYKKLKTKIQNILNRNAEVDLEEIIKIVANEFNVKAVEQTFNIIKSGNLIENSKFPAKKEKAVKVVKGSNEELEQKISEDLELLKKMTSTSSGRKRKIRSEEGDWIDPNEIEGRVISHEPAQPIKEKRKRKVVKKMLDDEDLNTTEDPFRLILLNEFDDQNGEAKSGQIDENGDEFELVKAPFKVEICTSVILLMDLHSHLHSSEIIGLLGGKFIKIEGELPILRINYGFPCSTAHSTGTQVDVDPLSEMEAGDYFESNGVRMAGWYHSHPNFEPNPSLRDLETQTMYQGLFKNSEPDTNIEPFVGVIVNPYMAATESSSHIECFYVVPTLDPTQERLPYRIPIEKIPLNQKNLPQILDKMREIIFEAENSSDRLDMRKNAQPGIKRIEKLFSSLKSHGNLSEDQMEQVKNLFNS